MKLSKTSKNIFILLLFVGGFIAIFYYFISPTTVQRKANPKNSHKTTLSRLDGIDVNFIVTVDGEGVFSSPDFAPVDFDFREQIAWDKTGNIVVLEVAGKRLFAYDAEQKRQLSDTELLSVEYVPFSEYWYEGKLPEEQKR